MGICASVQSTRIQCKPQNEYKCSDHPDGDLSFFYKTTDRLVCRHCRRNIPDLNNVVSVVTFVNGTEFSEKVNYTIQQLTKEIRDVRDQDKTLANTAVEFKQQISGYIDDIVKLLWVLKRNLHLDAETTVSDHREKLRDRLTEIEEYNKTIKAHRSKRSYEEKVSLLRSCSLYKQSNPVDLNLQYKLENNHVIKEWQNTHNIYLQAPLQDSYNRFDVSTQRRELSPETAGSECSSDDSGHVEVGFGSRISGATSRRKHRDEAGLHQMPPGNASQTPARQSTARLSKIQVSSQLECVKTLTLRGREITCTANTKYGNMILCDQRNSELLLLDSELKPLRSKHLSGRPGWIGDNSMRQSELTTVDYSRHALKDSALTYQDIQGPRYMSVDKEDNLYVLEENSTNVHMISSAGVYRGFVLIMDTPIVHISYLPTQQTFIVVSQNGERIDMYREVDVDDMDDVEEF